MLPAILFLPITKCLCEYASTQLLTFLLPFQKFSSNLTFDTFNAFYYYFIDRKELLLLLLLSSSLLSRPTPTSDQNTNYIRFNRIKYEIRTLLILLFFLGGCHSGRVTWPIYNNFSFRKLNYNQF